MRLPGVSPVHAPAYGIGVVAASRNIILELVLRQFWKDSFQSAQFVSLLSLEASLPFAASF